MRIFPLTAACLMPTFPRRISRYRRWYISMEAAWGIDSMKDIAGYLHDTPQPTTHFNILRERGIDTKAIRVDEAAPLYYIDRDFEAPQTLPECHFIVSEQSFCQQIKCLGQL